MEKRVIKTRKYVSMLRELTEEGKEVSLLIAGNSMSPFLVHGRDSVLFKKPSRSLRSGDIVFYQRENGQFILHRIWKVKEDGFYIVGDAHNVVEGPVKREQIFAIVTKVCRKGKWIEQGDFWWEFFEHVWIHMIPFRKVICRMYAICQRILKLK